MKHVGDVTKLSGYELPAVDCISGGSPCQDLSVAGRRAGMKHEDKGDGETTRSGLFMDQMRIVKEMRERDRAAGRSGRFVRPRYMVWENVPGALSSPGKDRKGEDFAAVIEEIIKVAEPGAALRVRVPNGGWPNSGCYYAEDGSWSVAWRVHDAQFWGATQYADDRVLFLGTPQRRRRIALVADFGGLSAAEVLFVRKGLSWDSGESEEARQGTTAGTESGLGDAISFQERAEKPGGINGDVAGTLDASYYKGCVSRQGIERDVVIEPTMIEMTSTKNTIIEDGVSCTLTARMGIGGNQVNAVLPFDTTQITHPANYSHPKPGDPCHPLAAGAHPPAICYGIDQQGGKGGANYSVDVAPPILSDSHGTPHAVCIGNGQLHNISMSEVSNTLDTMHDAQAVMVPDVAHALKNKANCDFREDSETYVTTPVGSEARCTRNMVRRLTPGECEKLQGYPENWTNIGEWVDTSGKKHRTADTNRYKALGNSICLPFWYWLMRRISAQYERPATLGSLFDGIGGFPLCWERCNGKGSALWAAEIEEFPIAVTKKHFPEEETA